MSGVSWSDIESITRGQFGRMMAPCPLCSAARSTPDKRRSKVLAVTRDDPEFAVYYCNHCGANGYATPATGSVIDLAERRRRQEKAKLYIATDKAARTQTALELFKQASEWRSTPVESYLRFGRGISNWLDDFALDDVRYHSECPFGKGQRLPCMLALVRDIRTNAPVAVHRTALDLSGKHPFRIERKSLGPVGGGAIKLSPDDEVTHGLLIGEGIETVLSASRQFQFKPAWSLIDKNGVSRFPVLPGIECVTIAVDNDPNGDGELAAAQCTHRLVEAGVEVIRAKPNLTKDFNDVLRGQVR